MNKAFIKYVLIAFYSVVFVVAVRYLLMQFDLGQTTLKYGRQRLSDRLSITERNTDITEQTNPDGAWPTLTNSGVYYDIYYSDGTTPVIIYDGMLQYNDNGDIASNLDSSSRIISTDSIRLFKEGDVSIVNNKLVPGTYEKRYKKNSDGSVRYIVYVKV